MNESNYKNRVIRFMERPKGWVDESIFRIEDAPMPEPGDGEMLLRVFYHSLDPYMRPRMTETDSYVEPFEPGQIMEGGGMAEVIESNHPDYKPGDVITGMLDWALFQVHDGSGYFSKIEPMAPWKDFLGVLGGASLTAYAGLKTIGEPKEGETLYVSAASGAVGSIVAQMGKIYGCRVVGSAGSDDKVAWLRDELGLDAAFNYKTVSSMDAALKEHCPDGIDIDFENVGGETLQAVLDNINHFGRIIMCGTISEYNEEGPGLKHVFRLVNHRVRMQGFIVSDHFDLMPDFINDMTGWLKDGKIKYRETIVEGLDNMPEALVGLFEGKNFGKLLVKLADEPAQ